MQNFNQAPIGEFFDKFKNFDVARFVFSPFDDEKAFKWHVYKRVKLQTIYRSVNFQNKENGILFMALFSNSLLFA